MKNVGVIGGGLIGASWAAIFSKSGLNVYVHDSFPSVFDTFIERVTLFLEELKSIDPKIQKLISEDSIVVLNKSDVDKKQNHNFKQTEVVLVSVKNNENIIELISKIKEKLGSKFITSNDVLITRERHRAKLNECLKEIDNFLQKDQNKDIETAAEDLRLATRHLGGIVGKVDVEEILGSIFRDFCIGK